MKWRWFDKSNKGYRCRQVSFGHCSMDLLRLTNSLVSLDSKKNLFTFAKRGTSLIWILDRRISITDHHRLSLSLSKLFIRVKFSSDRATQDVTEDDHRIAPIKRNFDGASSRINRLLRQSKERREWRIGHAYRPSFVPFTRRLLLLLPTK